MKVLTKLLTLTFLITINLTFAQVAEDSWSIGWGVTYPRFMSVWSQAYSGTQNYGAYLSLKRNFSENVALRLLTNYNYMEAIYDFPTGEVTESVTLGTASLDLLYYPAPCSPISPYIGAGLGGVYFRPKNAFEVRLNNDFLEYQMNLRAGAEWRISSKWKIVTEACYFTPSSNKLDGENDAHEHKGLFGTNCDTYMNFNLGLLYYFDEGNPSQKCDRYSGVTVGSPITNQLTIQDVEKIVKENLPKEVVKKVIVEKPIPLQENKWILVGVNFEFNSANLTKESFPILLNAIQVLTQHPDIQAEIIGFTDNLGSNDYNMMLSEKRANVVKTYLIANGIKANRLFSKGMGESNPIGDNRTIEGRTLNRRIEFKVKP